MLSRCPDNLDFLAFYGSIRYCIRIHMGDVTSVQHHRHVSMHIGVGIPALNNADVDHFYCTLIGK